MEMSKIEGKELSKKIMDGIKLANEKMWEEARLRDESKVISVNGKPTWVRARDLKN